MMKNFSFFSALAGLAIVAMALVSCEREGLSASPEEDTVPSFKTGFLGLCAFSIISNTSTL